jgi:hypothetical protein
MLWSAILGSRLVGCDGPMTQRADEQAAIHLWRGGQPVSFADIKAHIASCIGGVSPPGPPKAL